MNKRTFLKMLAAMAGPLTMRAEKQKLTNWSGNLTYSTENVHEASSVEQVRSLIKAEQKCKVLGTRHCFNNIADSRDNLISMKPMNDVSIDTAAHTVTVGPGVTYGYLAPILEAKGLALHNLASLPHISVAGACTTATHGSGERNGNLATAAVGLELITAAGDLVKLSQKENSELFRGAVVGLGALGAITKVTLAVQPTYKVKQYVYENLPFEQMKDHFDEIEASGYSVSLFTDWRKDVNELWVKSRVGVGYKPFPAPKEYFGAKLATRNLHPIADLSAENCTEQMGVEGPWYDRLPHFRMGFTPSAGKELQTEYFVPRAHAVEAILALRRLSDQVSPHLLISEIRTIAADDLWMSMAHKRPSVALHFTWKQDWPAVSQLLPVVERELGPFQPRPHWGKLFAMPAAELHSRYERLPDFLALAKKFDPNGKFRNDFLNKNIFSA